MQAARLDPSLEKPVQALRTSLNTASLSDDPGYQLLLSGRALAALGNWDLAALAFRNALAARPGYAEALAWLGLVQQQLGQDASGDFQHALELAPGSAIVQGLYGMYLQRSDLPDAARAAFQKAAALQPDDPGWQVALGSAYEQTGDLISAYPFYLHAVELAPNDPIPWRALVAYSINNGVDVDTTGLPSARRLISLAPDDWQSYDLAGQAASLLGDFTTAETFLKKALELAPLQAAPALHMGLVELQAAKLETAFSYLSLAKTLDPDGLVGLMAGRVLGQYFP